MEFQPRRVDPAIRPRAARLARAGYVRIRSAYWRLRDYIASIAPRGRDVRDPWKRFYYLNPAKHGSKLKKDERYRPLMLACETVNSCNNLCIVCAYEPQKRPKRTMSLSLFEKVLRDYSELGGGYLSLTPLTGDILMDKHLLARFEVLKRYPAITEVGATTNAAMLDRFSDAEVRTIVDGLDRILISVYGIDREEYCTMTKRDTYDRMVDGIRRILSIRTHNVGLAFRLLKPRSRQEIDDWIANVVGCREGLVVTSIMTGGYANFSTLDTTVPLPFGATWAPAPSNRTQCLIPLLAAHVASNGDVGFCACVGSIGGLLLGNIKENSLAEIYNSSRSRALWDWRHQTPKACETCTFHKPLSLLRIDTSLIDDPLSLFGA